MNAQYYLQPDKEGWEKFLSSTSLDSLQKLQMGVIRVDRIWIDEASAEWQIDYRTIAPIVDSTLEAAGKELAAAFSLHAVHWHSLNKPKEMATPKVTPTVAPSPKKEFKPEIHNPEPVTAKQETIATKSGGSQ
jgi:hypothetical protein